jgi:hypothetical protein
LAIVQTKPPNVTSEEAANKRKHFPHFPRFPFLSSLFHHLSRFLSLTHQMTDSISAEQHSSMANASDATAHTSSTADENITVFHDRLNYTVKHPLQNTWTLWFDSPGKKANIVSWSQNLKEVTSVDAVEDFWG